MQIKRDADGSIAFSTQGQESLQDVLAAICSLPAGIVATATIATASVPKASGNGVHREPAKESPAKELPTARESGHAAVGTKIPKSSELPLIEGEKVLWPDVDRVAAAFGFTGNRRALRTALKNKQRQSLQTA